MDDSLDTGVPHIARVYNYWLGGTDNFPADRAAAEQVMASFPDIAVSVRAQPRVPRPRRALPGHRGRACGSSSIIGTGLPAAGNTHEVAQRGRAGVPGGLRGQRPDRGSRTPARC